MKRVKFTLDIGFVGATHVEIFEFEDDTTDAQIEEEYETWVSNYMDGGWHVLEDGDDGENS